MVEKEEYISEILTPRLKKYITVIVDSYFSYYINKRMMNGRDYVNKNHSIDCLNGMNCLLLSYNELET
jgi:hypothetical protein